MKDLVFGIAMGLLGAAFFIFVGIGIAQDNNKSDRYRDCRKIASIETCVAHVGLEKPATP